MSGHFALILHAHLPFVRHPEHEHFLEEEWLFEAITETYIPLLRVMQRLTGDGVPFKLAMSITPTFTGNSNSISSMLRFRARTRSAILIGPSGATSRPMGPACIAFPEPCSPAGSATKIHPTRACANASRERCTA